MVLHKPRPIISAITRRADRYARSKPSVRTFMMPGLRRPGLPDRLHRSSNTIPVSRGSTSRRNNRSLRFCRRRTTGCGSRLGRRYSRRRKTSVWQQEALTDLGLDSLVRHHRRPQAHPKNVRYRGYLGRDMLGLSSSQFDPTVWSGRALQEDFVELAVSGLASMYPASDWSVLCSRPSWISARVRSH
jgi:hypothetical protein